jgi:hypothetical protein
MVRTRGHMNATKCCMGCIAVHLLSALCAESMAAAGAWAHGFRTFMHITLERTVLQIVPRALQHVSGQHNTMTSVPLAAMHCCCRCGCLCQALALLISRKVTPQATPFGTLCGTSCLPPHSSNGTAMRPSPSCSTRDSSSSHTPGSQM